jgi:integrase
LAKAGLVTPRDNPDAQTVPLLGAFIDAYILKRNADTNPGTRVNYGQARRYLVDFFGATRPMNKINQGDAEDFRLDLLSRLADNTARRVCGRAKQFFAAAIRHKLIVENPFVEMKCSIIENRERDRFITRAEAAKVLEACPDAQWRLLFALSRFGGLRCPSEHLGLKWQDIDWEHYRMTIRSPKTARKGKPSRLVPIFPELRPYLEEAGTRRNPVLSTLSPATATPTRTCGPSYAGSSPRQA